MSTPGCPPVIGIIGGSGIYNVEGLTNVEWREVATPAGSIRALTPPVEIGTHVPRMDAVPALGEHTDVILNELGFSRDQIAAWHTEGTI